MTPEEAKAERVKNIERAPFWSGWEHVISGRRFTVLEHAVFECSFLPEFILVVICFEDGSSNDPIEKTQWCLPASEFFSKFEQID